MNMYFPKDTVLSALMELPRKKILGVCGIRLDDLIHNLCGDHPDARNTENVKSALASLECDGAITLIRMDISNGDGPILGIHLNQES